MERWQAWLSHKQDGSYKLKIYRERQTRTLPQNNYYWGCLVSMISAHVGDDILSMHEILKYNFIGTERVDGIMKPISSTSLSKIEFIEYIDKIKIWAFNFLQLTIPDPKEFEALTK